MRLAYIVSAYKLPNQLIRLLERLDGDRTTFVIHVDRKTDDRTYRRMVEGARTARDVHFLERHVCHWGGFGHVRATLKGIRHLLTHEQDFDYVVLLTGQDYPLRPPTEIERFLGDAEGRSFMAYASLPSDAWGALGGLDRIEKWHLTWYRRLHLQLPLKRRVPGGLRPFGGSGYWCLSRAAVDVVHRFVEEHPSYVRFFRHVFVPDEIFFHTILLNSPLKDTVVDDDLRYIDWSRKPWPAILRSRDFESMAASGKLFARKFDETVDGEILDRLDELIDRERSGRPAR